MNVKGLKTILSHFADDQIVILKSASGVEWEARMRDVKDQPKNYKKKPNMYIDVV